MKKAKNKEKKPFYSIYDWIKDYNNSTGCNIKYIK